MTNPESRRLYSNLLGFYVQTCFRIHIETNITFKHMTEKDYSVLTHEYIHFLQDITTSYGAFNAHAISEFMKSAAEAIRLSPDGTLDVPYTPDIAQDNVYANYCLRELTYGCSAEIDSVKDILELHNIKEDLDSASLDSIPSIEIDLIDGNGKARRIEFGACAIMESMAYMMEQYIAPIKVGAPDYPYKVVEKVAKEYYPEFAEDKLNLIALCDASLLTSSPGHTFLCYLIQFKEENWLPKDPSTIYGKLLDDGYIVRGSRPGQKSFVEEMDEMCLLAIQSLQTYFNESLPKCRKWITDTFNRGFALRIEKRDFMLDIARGGNIMHNPYLKALINDFIGTPIITNPLAEGTIKSPNVPFESDFYLFTAVGEVFQLFDKGKCNCGMKNICSRNGGPVDEICNTAPWSHDVSVKNLCPYSLLWNNWAFKRCKPRGQRRVDDI